MEARSYSVKILGRLWQPGYFAASKFTFQTFQEAPDLNGEYEGNVLRHVGDFSEVIDYEVTAHGYVECDHGEHPSSEVVREFEKGEDSELTWSDCMYPAED